MEEQVEFAVGMGMVNWLLGAMGVLACIGIALQGDRWMQFLETALFTVLFVANATAIRIALKEPPLE